MSHPKWKALPESMTAPLPEPTSEFATSTYNIVQRRLEEMSLPDAPLFLREALKDLVSDGDRAETWERIQRRADAMVASRLRRERGVGVHKDLDFDQQRKELTNSTMATVWTAYLGIKEEVEREDLREAILAAQREEGLI